ncbi:hypothetical protein NKI50_04395 [Mesorhizobium sp. M0563]|uniref:hypothetical protein n=1 Tax=unclassified Mesorhizobium TaxID=325217 RepID=UPI0033362142
MLAMTWGDALAPEISAVRHLSEEKTASSAAFAVGYESVSQFTREHGHLFGLA